MSLDTAVFTSYAAARAAADAAMPRRKHNRPYPVESGYEAVASVPCPVCGTPAGAECLGAPVWHDERVKAARNVHRWIVWTGNIILLADGSMYDYQRKVTVR